MEQSLQEVWKGAAASPFIPTIGKDSQFTVGFSLLTIGILLIGFFGMNRSLANVLLIGTPAGLAVGFGAVYMICAVGVYV